MINQTLSTARTRLQTFVPLRIQRLAKQVAHAARVLKMTNRYLNLLGKLILLINLTLHVNGYAPKLILISFDGFRADYLHPKLTPTMARLAKEGVQALTMRSMYCTKTFPNHFSIATGSFRSLNDHFRN